MKRHPARESAPRFLFMSRLMSPETILSVITLAHLSRPAEMQDGKAAGYDSLREPIAKEVNWSFQHPFSNGSKPQNQFRFCPRDKNETANLGRPKSFLCCPTFCPKRLREDTRRDSVARQSKPITQLESTGMTPQQTCVKEWE